MKPLKIAVLLIIAAILTVVAPSTMSQNALRIFSESGGAYSSFLPEAPTYVNARVLAANVAESFTVPTGATRVIFSSTCNFYANPTTTAAVPAADVTDGTASFLNPSGWGIRDAAATISVIAPTACVVTGAFFK